MGKKHNRIRSTDDIPGPGAYKWDIERGPAWTMAGRNHTNYGDKENGAKPGPSTYDPKLILTHPHTPGKSMSGRYKHGKGEDVPGVGTYHLKYNDKKGGWTIAHRPKTANPSITPGPAAYNVKLQSRAPAFTMGSKDHKKFDSENNPGPDYHVWQKWDKGIKFTTDKKGNPVGIQSMEPGPGAYSIMTNFGNPDKGFYIGVKYPDHDKENFPGPGAYNTENECLGGCDTCKCTGQKGPAYSMVGTKNPNASSKDNYPGPGNYNIEKSHNAISKSHPNTVFTSGARVESKTVNTQRLALTINLRQSLMESL